MKKFTIGKYIRISKSSARKRNELGMDCYVYPCNVLPRNLFIAPLILRGTDSYEFDKWVNEFEAYNCNKEVGRYASFYAKITGCKYYNK